MPIPFPGRASLRARRPFQAHSLRAAALAGLLALASTVLAAQDGRTGCPAAADLTPGHMLGLWRAEFDGLAQGATLLLEPHREYAQSLSGEINRNGARARIAADLEGGELTLEESADGQRIDAAWVGDVVEGSCGREIRGTWQPQDERPPHPFVLRKL